MPSILAEWGFVPLLSILAESSGFVPPPIGPTEGGRGD